MEEWALHEHRMTPLIDQPFRVHDEIPAGHIHTQP